MQLRVIITVKMSNIIMVILKRLKIIFINKANLSFREQDTVVASDANSFFSFREQDIIVKD